MCNKIVFWMLMGWLAGIVVKYAIVGLEQWDTALHPERLQADLTGPFARFAKPFLGAFAARI